MRDITHNGKILVSYDEKKYFISAAVGQAQQIDSSYDIPFLPNIIWLQESTIYYLCLSSYPNIPKEWTILYESESHTIERIKHLLFSS